MILEPARVVYPVPINVQHAQVHLLASHAQLEPAEQYQVGHVIAQLDTSMMDSTQYVKV